MKQTVIAVALSIFAAIASANGPAGDGHGGPGGGPGGFGGGAEVIVTAEGNAIVTVGSQSSSGTATEQVKAISPSGATLWTITLDSAHGPLVLSGSNLLDVVTTRSTTSGVTTASTKVTAISTATGATAWTLTLDGLVDGFRPFSGGTYAIVVKPATTSTGTATRSLVAISNSGAVLFTVAL